jgi:signal transduction histidine kinase
MLLNPRGLFVLTLLTVFLIELCIMLVFHHLPKLPGVVEAVLDAILLSVIFVPFLYLFFLKPYQNYIRLSSEAESERRKSEELNRVKSEIISIAAHELRTPLTAISGYAELLQMNALGDEESRRNCTEIIIRKAEGMERLISDLLDLSRIDQGQPLQIHTRADDIVAVVAAVVAECRDRHPKRTFNLDLPTEPVVLRFDKVRMEQVLDNLLSNAIRFSPTGAPVSIISRRQSGMFHLEVSDQGVGMTPEQLSRVFEKFYRVDTSDTSPAGLGLGMALVRQIIVEHGGEIRLESSQGAGTRVCVALPIT